MNPNRKEESAIAVGNFDGFHLGHRKIIAALKDIAARENLISMVLTFSPNPKLYLKKEPSLIHTEAQRRTMLESQEIDKIVFIDFAEVVNMTPDDFLKSCLIEKYRMKYIVVGENFKFGKDRSGGIESLYHLSEKYGFGLQVVRPEQVDGMRISSSLIRKRLARGRIEEANRMLGREYCIEGVIGEGDKVGRQLGFPTINLETDNPILPEGVFKTRVKIADEVYDSITNIGYRPTFLSDEKNQEKEKRVETHIFDFDKTLYGKHVQVYFEKKIRDEMKFDSKVNLIEQIKRDIKNTKVDKGAFF